MMKRLLMILPLCFACSAWAQMETGTVTRIKVLSTAGKELTIELQGWTVQYNPGDYKGEMIALNVGTNGIITSGRVVCNEADIEASDPYRGLILTDVASNKWVVTVSTNGTLETTLISASPEVSFRERQKRIRATAAALVKARADYKRALTDADRVKALAEFARIEAKP